MSEAGALSSGLSRKYVSRFGNKCPIRTAPDAAVKYDGVNKYKLSVNGEVSL
jgi:hypothetical protein